MTRPLSNDLRKRIIEAKLRGDTEGKIAAEKEVNKSTVTKLWSLYRRTGRYEPRPCSSGRKPALSVGQLEQITRKINEQPDVTLQELIDELRLPICVSALCRTVNNKLGYRFKKTRHAAEQNREDVRARREEWKNIQPAMNAEKLVFLDESGINAGMTRLYGRGRLGARVIDYVPDVRFERTSILSSVRLNGELVPLVFEGSLTGELFKEYVSKCLVPTLQEGDIVIMDNLTSHKVKGVTELIMASGANVVYLPPYSPDLNPIEMMWSKVKAYLRKAKARTKQALNDAIAVALNLISQTDISGWFAKDGYGM
jgi:transposase